jgi:hypothetical protein
MSNTEKISLSGIVDLTDRISGTVQIGGIVRSHPRFYEATCLNPSCKSSFTLAHQAAMTRLNAGLVIECRNDRCRLGTIGQEHRAKDIYRQERQRELEQESAAYEAEMRARYGNSSNPEAR